MPQQISVPCLAPWLGLFYLDGSDPLGLMLSLQRDGAEADVQQNLAFFARNKVPSDVIVVSALRRAVRGGGAHAL